MVPKNTIFILFSFALMCGSVSAEEKSTLSSNSTCGDIAEGEFKVTQELHTYKIGMEPGDVLDVQIIPVGAYLLLDGELYEPTGQNIENILSTGPGNKLIVKSKALSGRGEYKVQVRNYNNAYSGNKGRAGMYEIHFSCIKRNGQKIIASS